MRQKTINLRNQASYDKKIDFFVPDASEKFSRLGTFKAEPFTTNTVVVVIVQDWIFAICKCKWLKSEVAVEEVSRNVTILTAMMRPSVRKTAKKQKMKNLLKGARPKEDSSNVA